MAKKKQVLNTRMYDILLGSIVTEKSMNQQYFNKYVFQVSKTSNKTEVKIAVEKIFNVKVASVNVVNTPPHKKRVGRFQAGVVSGKKKVIVTLQEGYSLDLSSVNN